MRIPERNGGREGRREGGRGREEMQVRGGGSKQLKALITNKTRERVRKIHTSHLCTELCHTFTIVAIMIITS